MREEHFYYPSADGKNHIHAVRWIPDGEIRAVVQMMHGMAEYIERYSEFARFLNRHNILVVGHDHLGHGLSAATPEDYGYFAEKKGNQTVIRDAYRLCRMTQKEYGKLPYFLFGHSMGSFLARQFMCFHGEELDGAIICGTGYQPMAVLRAGMAVCRAQALVKGWRYRSPLIQLLSTGKGNDQFEDSRTDADWLSRNPENVDAYIADPKCGFTFTLNGYYNMFLGMAKISRKEVLDLMPRELPVFFISGACDPVGNNGKGVEKVVQQFEELGMEDVTCKLYEEDRHEILNEVDREIVFEDVWNWISKYI